MEININELIKQAKELKDETLDLSNCKLEVLPDEIGDLTSLKNLDLRENKLSDLPACLNNLQNLERLHLRENSFEDFPKVILELKKLTHLCISQNSISIIPEEINLLTNLDDFHLADNIVKSIPESIKDLTELEHLCLNNNLIETIPESLINQNSIAKFHVSNNKIKFLPININNISFLTSVSLRGNPLIEPPLEIINNGYKEIINYFLNKEKGNLFRIPINDDLKTALKQYLVFFNDFVLASKGQEINFEVKSYNEGIELDINVSSKEDLENIQGYLEEYISFTKTNIENLNPSFKSIVDDNKKDILIADLKNQVRSLQSSIELRSLENKFLHRESEKLFQLLSYEKQNPQPLLLKNEAIAISNSTSDVNIALQIKTEIPILQNELFELKKLLGESDDKSLIYELNNIDSKVLELEDCESDPNTIDKVPFKQLKRILDEINNPDSTTGKALKATAKAASVVKKLGKTYNKFAQWLALPQVPDVFVD